MNQDHLAKSGPHHGASVDILENDKNILTSNKSLWQDMPRLLTRPGVRFMKRGSTLFLKLIILLIAIVVAAWMIVFPQLEGRAANLDLISIYTDPFIIYGYIASIPFFVGLYQALNLLNLIDANKAFSQGAINTLKNMKFASLSLIGFIALAVFYIRFFAHGDDPSGPTMLGILASFAVAIITTAAGVFQRLLQNAVDIKSENDLTV